MSPQDAYQALAANQVDYVALEGIKGRVSATLALIYPPGIGVVLPGERWDKKAQPMLDYFLAFQESFNRFPGFNYEVQGVYQERVEGRDQVLHVCGPGVRPAHNDGQAVGVRRQTKDS